MSISTQDLGAGLLVLAVFLGVLAAGAGLAVWIARRRGSTTITLDAALAVAQVWLALAAVGVVLTVWRALTGGDTWVAGLPLQLEWPTPLPLEATGDDPELLSAVVATADATIANLPLGTRAVLGAAELAGVLLIAFPALAIVVLCRRAVRGGPFAGAVSRWLMITAAVVLVAGTLVDVLGAMGRTMASMEVLPDPASGADVTAPWTFTLSVPLWPIGAALALAALGAVFRYGAVLQRDSEGLV